MPDDYYELLGVGRDADGAAVKKAFRRLARELHPDVNTSDPTAEAKFKQAAEAYEVLSDPERRRIYDAYGHEGLSSSGRAPNFEGFGSLGDLFNAFFGGGAGGGYAGGPARGSDAAVEVEIELAQVAAGASVPIAYDAVERCEHCRGNGAEPGTPIESCARCGGTGQLQAVARTPFGQVLRATVCDVCAGDGRVAREPCRTCQGRGHALGRRELSVDIPPGISDGQRVRLSGQGHAGEGGGPPGDLYVLVRVADDERFVRDGDDLITIVEIAAPLAALGATVAVPTLEGERDVELAAGTQPGETVLLRGMGLPSLRGRRMGNLRAVVNVVIPRRLSSEQRALTERLAESLTEDNLRSDEGLFSKLRRALRT